jgi:hypothetical protein
MIEELSPKRQLDNVRERLANLRIDLDNARGGFGWSAPEDDPHVLRYEQELRNLEAEEDRLEMLVPGACR